MTTKATRETEQLSILAQLARQARTTAGNHAALGRSRVARDYADVAEYLESLILVLRADGRGLPVQSSLF